MRQAYAEVADETQNTLRDEARQWKSRFEQVTLEYEQYRSRVDEQGLSLPAAKEKISDLKQKLQAAQREIQVRDVEKKVTTHQLSKLREDNAKL